MARLPNPRCLSCAALSTEEARQRSCWDAKRCHNRRSHYRNRIEPQQPDEALPTIDIGLPANHYAVLYRYLEPTGKCHAVRSELYQGSKLIARTSAQHVGALTEGEWRTFQTNVLKGLSQFCGSPIALYRNKVDLTIRGHGCPVAGCPFAKPARNVP